MKRVQFIVLLFFTVGLLFGCENKDAGKGTSEQDLESKEEKSNELVKKKMTEEELVYQFFEAINTNNEEQIFANAYDGQTDAIKAGINQIKQGLESLELTTEVEEIVGKATVDNYSLFLVVNRLLDKEGNVLSYQQSKIPLMSVDGKHQYVWDATLLPEQILQQETELQEQITNLLQNDEKVRETLLWLEEQNRIHQEAFNLHLQAHQQAVDQHNQMVNQQMVDQKNQMINQQMTGF